MTNPIIISLSILAAILALASIVVKVIGKQKYYDILKPLTSICILVIAFIVHRETSSVYSSVMIGGICLSLIGDVFQLRESRFVHGLAAFLFAHLFFALGFISIYGFYTGIAPLIGLLVIGLYYYSTLQSSLGKYRLPVLVYILVIIIMNWQATGLAITGDGLPFLMICIASLLFSFSDAVIAYDKFKRHFSSAQIWILSTYWIAIYVFVIAGLYV
ncbi:MAG: lysoplasmalogenase [Bacteroidia bacterium]